MMVLLMACLEPPPEVVPVPKVKPAQPVVKAPVVEFARAKRVSKSPFIEPSDPPLEAATRLLEAVVGSYGRDPQNPWAIGHAMLALGSDLELLNGKQAVPWLFENFAELRRVDGEILVDFPGVVDGVSVEPHTDLVLKALMETGVPLTDKFVVSGNPVSVADVYRNSLYQTYVGKDGTNFKGFGDAPWALQALSTAAPDDLAWTATGNHTMTMDLFTDVLAKDLEQKTQFMVDAMKSGETVQKRRQGIFADSCGGQHLVQGVAYAVARGFGSAESRAIVEKQVEVLFWRVPTELKIYDDIIESTPSVAPEIRVQKLKFLGHFLETAHKMAALELYVPTDEQKRVLSGARKELVITLSILEETQVIAELPNLKGHPQLNQMFLDMVGDGAHALRGIRLSTGEGSVTW